MKTEQPSNTISAINPSCQHKMPEVQIIPALKKKVLGLTCRDLELLGTLHQFGDPLFGLAHKDGRRQRHASLTCRSKRGSHQLWHSTEVSDYRRLALYLEPQPTSLTHTHAPVCAHANTHTWMCARTNTDVRTNTWQHTYNGWVHSDFYHSSQSRCEKKKKISQKIGCSGKIDIYNYYDLPVKEYFVIPSFKAEN